MAQLTYRNGGVGGQQSFPYPYTAWRKIDPDQRCNDRLLRGTSSASAERQRALDCGVVENRDNAVCSLVQPVSPDFLVLRGLRAARRATDASLGFMCVAWTGLLAA